MRDTKTRLPAISDGVPGIERRLPLYAAWIGYGALLFSMLVHVLRLPVEAGGFAAYATRQDFVGIYLGAHMVATGQSAQLYDLEAQLHLQEELMTPYAPLVHILYFVYPAWIAVLLAPLALMPYMTAFLTWAGVNVAAAVVVIARLVRSTAEGANERFILLLVALGFTPLWYTLWQGQTGIIVCLSLTGTLLALRAGRDREAGVWLVLGMIKPQLIALPVLALLLLRRWVPLAILAAGAVVIFALSLAVLGNWVPAYSDAISTYVGIGASAGDDPAIMHNWRGLVFRLLGTDTGPLAGGIVAALTLVSVALVIAVCWPRPRAAGTRTGWEIRFALAVLLGMLVNPHFYLQDAVVGLVPGFILWRASSWSDTRLRVLRGLLLAGPFAARLALSWAPPVVEIGSWYLALLVLATLWAWPSLERTEERVTLTASSAKAALPQEA
jgi:hypothetical protein